MSKKISIMQPYLFPYLGYFQMISAVDTFVLYDDVQFIQGGWINRNKILVNGRESLITLPLKKAGFSQKINERVFSEDFHRATDKLLRGIRFSYERAPHFRQVYPLLESIIKFPEKNLALFLENSIRQLCLYLDIRAEILVSSRLATGTDLNRRDRLVSIIKELGGDTAFNAIGGTSLYSCEDFQRDGITLKFIRMRDVRYCQNGSHFVPSLSIIDVLMFNALPEVREMLSCYSLEDNLGNAA